MIQRRFVILLTLVSMFGCLLATGCGSGNDTKPDPPDPGLKNAPPAPEGAGMGGEAAGK